MEEHCKQALEALVSRGSSNEVKSLAIIVRELQAELEYLESRVDKADNSKIAATGR